MYQLEEEGGDLTIIKRGDTMDSDRVEVLLLKLIEDVAEIKGKLNILEEIKIEQKELTVRVDRLEAKGDRHEKQITSLENRSNKLEEYIRNEMTETNKSNKTIFISVGICIVTAVVNLVFSLI